ncbi:MAG TPA: UbiA-like polyprenyltransferase [Fimbriimonadales bacterium]|nr:UbiA-like polyprenyltransferase [Fimbriimonadales bacterium]
MQGEAGTSRNPVSVVKTYLEMIKVEHSIFALPFAMMGMMYAANGFPGWRIFFWILVAMISARTAAMTFNRIADWKYDALNPRTASRAIPSGTLKLHHAWSFFIVACFVFFAAAASLNRLTLILSPIALFVLLFYSYTKRFTWLSHFFVGLSLGLAPAAAWIAVKGSFEWTPVFWILGVTFWTGGFDILYSLQDEEFDRKHGLQSITARFGRVAAIRTSRVVHALSVIFFILGGATVGAGLPYYCGVLFAAGVLLYEQSLVSPEDLSKLDIAFFTLNGYVAIGMFFFALLDVGGIGTSLLK